MFVKPHEGYVVRDPNSLRPLPPEGANVPDTAYWFQRLRDGDVEAVTPPAEPADPGKEAR